jgi:2-polyprenyl-3-methyl-5-hydroxy-6-metoxy-1,4-benzoquinol methylase
METTLSKYKYSYQNNCSGHNHPYLIAPLLEMLSQVKSSSQQKLRVLDLGCGNGSLTNLIAQQGYEIVGVEESESGIAFARSSFPDCQFIQGSIYNLPYAKLGKSFYIVISGEVIEHLFYPRELVRSAKKCLKPNGYLVITTPYHGYFKNLLLALFGKMDKHFTTLWDGGHIKFFSPKPLTYLLKTEGYKTIKFKFTGRCPYIWKSMLCLSSPQNN